MQSQGSRPTIQRDLALIYIALAHSTDQDLSGPEVDAISTRLRAWQTHATQETVLSAIKDALGAYTLETAKEEVERAVQRVRTEFEQELRQAIVDDLMEIALSDDRFLHEEGLMIGQLARAWDVHIEEKQHGSWTVLSSNGGDETWTSVHDLALVYLNLAHHGDGNVDDAEAAAIAKKLGEWIPDAEEKRVLEIVRGAMAAYVQGDDDRLFEASVEALRKFVPPHQRSAMLADLIDIASADGVMGTGEQQITDKLARAWKLQLDEQDS